jgi:uncharacterized protein YkwD
MVVRAHLSSPGATTSAIRGVVALALLCSVLLLAPTEAHARAIGSLPNCSVVASAASAVPRQAPTVRLARAAVCLINHRRARRGMPRLRVNRRLSRAAIVHTHDMVHRSYFAHVSGRGRDIVDRLRSTGYLGGRFAWHVGENLAWGSGNLGTPRAIVRSWMNSSGHRDNMLNPGFREIGIGVIARAPMRTGLPAATYTTTFGVRD